jgi:DNA-binding NarL/FixJ family response regulator
MASDLRVVVQQMNKMEEQPVRTVRASDVPVAREYRNPIKIWHVDDDRQYRELLGTLLSEQEGIECQRDFPSADAALSALASKLGPDVLLLDICMGGQSGLDAIAPIKSLARATRVLMLTTFYDSDAHSRALEEGASGFLLKHDSLDQLLEQIRKPDPEGHIRRRRRRRQAEASKADERKPGRSTWWRRLSWRKSPLNRPKALG